jgi:hypothetical protein
MFAYARYIADSLGIVSALFKKYVADLAPFMFFSLVAPSMVAQQESECAW